jgi:FK506-binding nuclear protein
MYSHEDSSYLLCTLQKGKSLQCDLDLNFAEGDKLCFLTKGNGIVHLTGYLIPEDDFNYDGMDGSDEESDVEESDIQDLRQALNSKKNGKEPKADKKNKKKAPVPEESLDDAEGTLLFLQLNFLSTLLIFLHSCNR